MFNIYFVFNLTKMILIFIKKFMNNCTNTVFPAIQLRNGWLSQK